MLAQSWGKAGMHELVGHTSKGSCKAALLDVCIMTDVPGSVPVCEYMQQHLPSDSSRIFEKAACQYQASLCNIASLSHAEAPRTQVHMESGRNDPNMRNGMYPLPGPLAAAQT